MGPRGRTREAAGQPSGGGQRADGGADVASNVEIKAQVVDPAALRARVEALAGPKVEQLEQEDTFFHTARGRLKLRHLGPDRGELIAYRRPDEAGPKVSEYRVSTTADPEGVRDLLADALGVLGVVRKHRDLYLLGRTRIHLDEVEGLGSFLELEVMLLPGEAKDVGVAEADRLMHRLDIHPEDLVPEAYLDRILGSKN